MDSMKAHEIKETFWIEFPFDIKKSSFDMKNIDLSDDDKLVLINVLLDNTRTEDLSDILPHIKKILIETFNLTEEDINSIWNLEKVNETPVSNITVQLLTKTEEPLPMTVQYFLAKHILSWKSPFLPFWKCWKYVWSVGFNWKRKEFNNQEIKSLGEWYTNHNPVKTYMVKKDLLKTNPINNRDFFNDDFLSLEYTSVHDNFSISRDEILKYLYSDTLDIKKFEELGMIQELFITEIVCTEYVLKNINFDRAVLILKKLSETSQIESQKVLYKYFSRTKEFSNKEQVYWELQKFVDAGFCKVLDVFKADVQATDSNTAFVGLESYCPQESVGLRKIKLEFIKDNDLEKDSQFEWTIYKNENGEWINHIQPL